MTVHFIGAGPGAADLVTVRGRDLIAACPVCLHAGSLVAPEILGWCPEGARIVDTAPLDLDAILALMRDAHAAGQDVVVHQRMYVVKNRLYQLIVVRLASADSKDQVFFDNFKLNEE